MCIVREQLALVFTYGRAKHKKNRSGWLVSYCFHPCSSHIPSDVPCRSGSCCCSGYRRWKSKLHLSMTAGGRSTRDRCTCCTGKRSRHTGGLYCDDSTTSRRHHCVRWHSSCIIDCIILVVRQVQFVGHLVRNIPKVTSSFPIVRAGISPWEPFFC